MSSISLLHDINSLRHKQYNVLLDSYLTRLSRLNCVQIFSADHVNLIVIQFYKYNPSPFLFLSYVILSYAPNFTFSIFKSFSKQQIHLNKQIKLNPSFPTDKKKKKFKIQTTYSHPPSILTLGSKITKRHRLFQKMETRVPNSHTPNSENPTSTSKSSKLDISSSHLPQSSHPATIPSSSTPSRDPPRNISNGIRRKGG